MAFNLGTNTITLNNESTFNGDVSGSETIAKTGTRTLTLNTQLSFTGVLAINGGTILDVVGAALNSFPTLSLASASTFDMSGESLGTGFTNSLDVLDVSAGSVVLINSTGVGDVGQLDVETLSNTGAGTLSGGRLFFVVNNPLAIGGILDVGSSISYQFPGDRTMKKGGAGTLIFSATGNQWFGGTSIKSGVLKLGIVGSMAGPQPMTLGTPSVPIAGTFDLNGFDATVDFATLTGTSSVGANVVTNNSGTASLFYINPSADFPGADVLFDGNIAIVKQGANSYSFPGIQASNTLGMRIDGGTIKMVADDAFSPTGFGPNIQPSGTFDFNGFGDSVGGGDFIVSGLLILSGGKSYARRSDLGGTIKVSGAGTAILTFGSPNTITLFADSTIDVDAGVVLLVSGSGTIECAGFTLSQPGAGTIVGTINP